MFTVSEVHPICTCLLQIRQRASHLSNSSVNFQSYTWYCVHPCLRDCRVSVPGVSCWPGTSVQDAFWFWWAVDGPHVELGRGDADLWVVLIPFCFHMFCIWLKKCNEGWDFPRLREASAQALVGFHAIWVPDALSTFQNPSPQFFHYTWKPCSQFSAFKCKNLLLCAGMNVNSWENVYELCERGQQLYLQWGHVVVVLQEKRTSASSLSNILVKVNLVECLHTAYWKKKKKRIKKKKRKKNCKVVKCKILLVFFLFCRSQ